MCCINAYSEQEKSYRNSQTRSQSIQRGRPSSQSIAARNEILTADDEIDDVGGDSEEDENLDEDGNPLQESNDFKVAKCLLEDLFIPDIIAFSKKVSSDAQSCEFCPTESRDLPPNLQIEKTPILLSLDGDYAQIQCLLESTMEKFKNEKIEYYKLPAATSLSTQPLDLMKSFMMMRKFSKDLEKPVLGFKLEAARAIEWMKSKGIDNASCDTFGCFIEEVPTMVAQSFRNKIIEDG